LKIKMMRAAACRVHSILSQDVVLRSFGALFLCITLVGCAGSQAYREGNLLLAEGRIHDGLGKLQEAVRLEPKNAEYRIALANQRASMINRLIAVAEVSRSDSRFDEADAAFTQALLIDPENLIVKQGRDVIAGDRRHALLISQARIQFARDKPTPSNEVLESVRTVLIEDPNHKEALALKSQIDDARSAASRREATLSSLYKKPISLQFRDVPLKSTFDYLAQVSGLNFFFDNDVRPDLRVTLSAKDTSLEDVMHLLMMTNQLKYKVLNENSVLIYPNSPQKVKDYQPLSVRSFFLVNADVKVIANSIKTIVKTQDIVVDERLGIIIMRDTPQAIRMAERIVALQDLGDPEVMLEVEILEVKRARLLELGVQWPSQLALSPLQIGTAPLTLQALNDMNASTTQATLGSLNINARKEDQNANLLANPRIRVRNKEKAKILIGDRIPVITTTSTAVGFAAESVNYIDVGLKLEVEPTIYLDDDVAIKVSLEVSRLVKEVLSKAGSLSYQIGTRGANTVLRLRNGETQILAGLISDEDRSTSNKVPGLGEMPILGRLFGSQKDDNQRSEILLSITPRVVRSVRRPDFISTEFESGTDSSIGDKPLSIKAVQQSGPSPTTPQSATMP
jgi:general secretion pathway protein D